ncbi:hypothetical protein [Marinoscillum sp.]|uniref:hypothetical protein n=1 Tax=Marinoscillum sp. TaxID=2024838 RepID=UPI003BAC2C3F
MKFIVVALTIAALITLSSCVKEDDRTPDCTKWEVEVNNPEATVKVKDGRLIVDIPNPTSFKDVRLIQVQEDGELHAVVGSWFNGTIDAISATDQKAYAEMRFSFGYQANAGTTFIGLAVDSDGNRKGYVNERRVYSSIAGPNFYYAEGTSAIFEPNHEINPLEIPQVSAAAKVFYMDFGVDPALSRVNPIASIHAELDFVRMGDRVLTPFDISERSEDQMKDLGFQWDDFVCNSLKK